MFILLMVSCSLPAAADGRADEVLRKLGERIAAMGEYTAEFEVMADGNRIEGTYAVSGDRYYMLTDEYEVVSDGKTRWEINHYDEEVLIDAADPEDRNILSNPTRAFEFAPDIFTSLYVGEREHDGQTVDIVELKPLEIKSPLLRVTIVVGRRSGLPLELRYLSDGLSEDVVVRMVEIRPGLPGDAAFSFDRSKYKGYDIVDFR